jgi:hypothetical protein
VGKIARGYDDASFSGTEASNNTMWLVFFHTSDLHTCRLVS